MHLEHTLTKHLTTQLGAKPGFPFHVWFCLLHVDAKGSRKGKLKVKFDERTYRFEAKLNPSHIDRGVVKPATFYAEVTGLAERPAPGTPFTWSFDGESGDGTLGDSFEDYTTYAFNRGGLPPTLLEV